MDYAAWIHRASEFMERLGRVDEKNLPDVDETEVRRAEQTMLRIFSPASAELAGVVKHQRMLVHGSRPNLEFEIKPPASEQAISEALKGTEEFTVLPDCLREFAMTASACCHFQYSWNPGNKIGESFILLIDTQDLTGGCHLCNLSDFVRLAEWICDLREIARAERSDEWCCTPMPFACLLNGDVLALDTSSRCLSPSVFYVSHEELSLTKIAESFDEFLFNWENVCYFSPEIWTIKPFLDRRTGYLNSESLRARQFRRVFEEAVESARS